MSSPSMSLIRSAIIKTHATTSAIGIGRVSVICCTGDNLFNQQINNNKSNNNNNNNHYRMMVASFSTTGRNRGAVPINKTPRGKAAAKMRIRHDTSTTNGNSGAGAGAGAGAGVLVDAFGSTTNNTGAPIDPSVRTTTNDTNNPPGGHSATHFIKGGTPCDPEGPPFHLADYGEQSLYTLVLLRHGESEWNSQNRYTGWCDVNLTRKGEMEARAAGRLLNENGIELDHAFTSVLKRASFSTNMCLNMAKQHWVPVTKTWRLNERHYGALQGYNKDTAWKELEIDQELVMQMRRSYDTRPPRMGDEHSFWHGRDRRYAKLSQSQLEKSRAESLKDTAERILPFFNSVIVPSIRSGNKCMIVSHANTIRTLIKHIDNISDEDIKGMSIPTGIPLLYRLDKDLRPVDPNYELEFQYMVEPKGYTWGTSRAHGFHGVYLGDLERLQDIQRKRDATNRDWQRIILRKIPGFLIASEESNQEKAEQQQGNSNNGDSQKQTDDTRKSLANKKEGRAHVFETRQLWWQLHTKMQEKPEYQKMLLLVRMKDHLEELMFQRKQRYLTSSAFESIINKLHLDAEGHLVEPFVALNDQKERDERQRIWYENLYSTLEVEGLIK